MKIDHTNTHTKNLNIICIELFTNGAVSNSLNGNVNISAILRFNKLPTKSILLNSILFLMFFEHTPTSSANISN